jgi:hypothetical protein
MKLVFVETGQFILQYLYEASSLGFSEQYQRSKTNSMFESPWPFGDDALFYSILRISHMLLTAAHELLRVNFGKTFHVTGLLIQSEESFRNL